MLHEQGRNGDAGDITQYSVLRLSNLGWDHETELLLELRITKVQLCRAGRSAWLLISTDICGLLTSATPLLDLDLQTALVDQVEGFDGIPTLYHA